MAVIIITAEGLGSELVAGIPLLVSLSTNLPSTIYFTIDGSEPSASGAIYVQPIPMPTDAGSIRLRALAVSGSDRSTLDVVYRVDTGMTAPPWRLPYDGAGVVVDAYGVPEVVFDGYGVDPHDSSDVFTADYPVRGADEPLQDYEFRYSTTGAAGQGLGTLIAIGFPDPALMARKLGAVDPRTSSPNHDNVFFNPRSLFVTVDGRDGYQDQSVFLRNRPWAGTLDPVKYLGGKQFLEEAPYISGGLVRSFYNWDKGFMVTYYWDSNELRWIRSIQSLDSSRRPATGMRPGTGPPMVFKWVYNKRSTI
jgi:hypothetical protein